MGWSREAVKNYKSLNKIDKEAWEIIGTGFKNIVPDDESDDVPESGTGVPKSYFSENLLRNILDLDPGQQVELCGYLAHRARWEYPRLVNPAARPGGDSGAV